MIFTKILQKTLKEDLTCQIMNQNPIPLKDRYQKEKIKEVIGLKKDGLGRKNTTKFVGLRAKTYSHLIDDGNEDKKRKSQKSVSLKKSYI